MQKPDSFAEVCSILAKHGEQIMKTINKRALLISDDDFEPVETDCREGLLVLASIFGFHRVSGTRDPILEPKVQRKIVFSGKLPPGPHFCNIDQYLEEKGVLNKRLEPGFIHFCQLNTKNSKGNYFSDQVHFFMIVYEQDRVTLLQAFGGVPGFTVKVIQEDINLLIKSILDCNHEVYKRLFEVPEDTENNKFSDLLQFDQTSFRALSIPLALPSLDQLKQLLTLYNISLPESP